MVKSLSGVVALTLTIACVALAQSPSAEVTTAAEQSPFEAYHADLDRAAFSGMANIVQPMVEAAVETGRNTHPQSPESLMALAFDQQYRQNGRPSVNGAMLRLNQLRPALEPILQSEGIPIELASVIVVESGGRTDPQSPKGALGLWQLMPDTARRYGLQVTASKDERLDVEKSTRAAARYLRDLYQQFGNWPLALAGYNTGEQSLQRAVDRGGTSEFFQLSNLRLLPQETRSYVPAVLSVMQQLGKYGLSNAPEAGGNTGSSNNLIFAVPGAIP